MEVCDADLADEPARPPGTCRISIPPVTISSHASTPDDDEPPPDPASQFTSGLWSADVRFVHFRLFDDYVRAADSGGSIQRRDVTGHVSSRFTSGLFTSGLSSPAVQSRLNYAESNPNLLSVSRTGTFSSGSTKNCSRRASNNNQHRVKITTTTTTPV